MNTLLIKLFQTWFKILETIIPGYARRWAVQLFFSPHNFNIPGREQSYLKQASNSKIDFNLQPEKLYNMAVAENLFKNKTFNSAEHKKNYTLYELGEGPLVLLVHGWSGRASQMGKIATALAGQGYKTISFNAFAHNGSLAKQTTVIEFAEIIKDIYRNHGPFKALIGHSLGGIALGNAILKGVKTEKLITIGSPTTFQYILDAFGEIVNANTKTLDYIKGFVVDYAKAQIEDFSLQEIGKNLSIPGLIIHDRDDREAVYSQALLFAETWSRAQLVSTKGLGHSRILRDKTVIQMIVDYIKSDTILSNKNERKLELAVK